jgi:hypothetical protein
MIRDPSDGSVRPTCKETLQVPVSNPVIETGTSGLPTDKLKVEELARLEKWREWLRDYQQRSASNPRTEGSHEPS